MDDTLKRLLDAEMRAERLAQQAESEQERVIQDALDEARRKDEQFTASIPALREGSINRANERAAQTIAQLRRRYEERQDRLREQARHHETAALRAAFDILIDPAR